MSSSCDCGRGCPRYRYSSSGPRGYDPLEGECEKEFFEDLRKLIENGPTGIPKRGAKNFPLVLADRLVRQWVGQSDFAEAFGVSTRQVQRLERKGLPSFGAGASKRYPFPQAGTWMLDYQLLASRNSTVRYLPLEIAIADVAMRSCLMAVERDVDISPWPFA